MTSSIVTASINAMRFFAHDFVGFFGYAYRYYFRLSGGLFAGCA